MKNLGSIVVALVAVGAVAASHAQQPTAQGGGARGQAPAGQAQGGGRGAPTAPPGINWPSPPLPDGPILEDTGIVHQIRIVPTKGFNQPFATAFLPDGSILVTERPGCLRIVRNGVLDPKHVAGLPAIQAAGLAGLMDIALHPRFAENQLIYLPYHRPAAGTAARAPLSNRPAAAALRTMVPADAGPTRAAAAGPGGPGTITPARARWDGTARGREGHLLAIPSGNASRIVFGKGGMVYDRRLRRLPPPM